MSRDAILGAVKSGLARGGDETARRAAVDERLAKKERKLIPLRGRPLQDQMVDLFQGEAERVQSTVERLPKMDALPKAVADYLAARNLPARIRRTPDARLGAAPWDGQAALTVDVGIAEDADLAGLSHAFAGVAETGSLVFLSGPDNPTTVNFLPVHHLAVVRASDLVGSYEDAWDRLRGSGATGTASAGFMPRTVNWITGPSRTADIELTLFLGVHGPKHLHIFIIEDQAQG